jgi:hypothetical protein
MKTDDFFRLTGGFRSGETHQELRERIDEIVNLEAKLGAAISESSDAEQIRLRLRQLKQTDVPTRH